MKTPWDKLVACLMSTGPLTDEKITKYALQGRYGSAARVRTEMAVRTRTMAAVAERRKAIERASKKEVRKQARAMIKDLL